MRADVGREMIIRRYKPGEEAELWQLYHDTTHHIIGRDYTPEQCERWAPVQIDVTDWKNRVRSRNPFVAERDGKILGFAELMPDGQIDYFYCHHQHQREGVGRKLYETIEVEARQLGLSCLRAAVSITAKPFFVSMGFEVVKEQRNIVCGTVAPNSIMKKRLSDNSGARCAAQLIETDRLRLRLLEPNDYEALLRVYSSFPTWNVTGTIAGHVHDLLRYYLEHQAKYGYGMLAVILKTDGSVIGVCGLEYYADVDGRSEVEITYDFEKMHWGQGYATEAAAAVRNHAFTTLGLQRLASFVSPDHIASRRVLEKTGLAVEKEIMKDGAPHLLYSLNKNAGQQSDRAATP